MNEFTWRGRPTGTVGELFDAMFSVGDSDEAAEFMADYRRHNQHADSNIGYLLGYVEPAERREQMYRWFGVRHPVFG